MTVEQSLRAAKEELDQANRRIALLEQQKQILIGTMEHERVEVPEMIFAPEDKLLKHFEDEFNNKISGNEQAF